MEEVRSGLFHNECELEKDMETKRVEDGVLLCIQQAALNLSFPAFQQMHGENNICAVSHFFN